jgi:hypothetical protein
MKYEAKSVGGVATSLMRVIKSLETLMDPVKLSQLSRKEANALSASLEQSNSEERMLFHEKISIPVAGKRFYYLGSEYLNERNLLDGVASAFNTQVNAFRQIPFIWHDSISGVIPGPTEQD